MDNISEVINKGTYQNYKFKYISNKQMKDIMIQLNIMFINMIKL